MTVRNRMIRIGLALVLLVGLATPAEAQHRGSLSISSEPDTRSGAAMVSDVDPVRRRMTIDEEVYRVGENTRIQDWNGQTVDLADIRTPNLTRGALVPVHEVDFIRFEAVRRRGQWTLTSVTVLEGPVK